MTRDFRGGDAPPGVRRWYHELQANRGKSLMSK
jgi:hypothetical protein